jgi:mannosyltransferase
MGKKRGDRTKENARSDQECNLDGEYTSEVLSYQDLSAGNIRDTLRHSRYLQILLSLTIIGIFLRFYHLGYNSLWLDEASTYTFASMSLPDIWQATTGGEFNPPLFYWIEHVMLVFGNNEIILRFVPAVLGVLTIPLVYIIGRDFYDRNVGIIAAAAVTFSPFLIFYSQEARAYSMMLFFIALAIIFFLQALKTSDLKNWALFGFFSALAFWSHFYGFVIVASLVLYALYMQSGRIREDLRNVKPIALAIMIFSLISLPLIIVTIQLFAKRTATAPTFGIQGIGLIFETFKQLSGFSDIAVMILLPLFIVGIIQAFLTDRDKGIFLVSLTVLTFIISLFLSYRIPMQPRYLIFLSIIFFIGIAIAYKPVFSLIGNRAVVYGFIALMVLLSAPLLVDYYSGYSKEDWRGVSSELGQMTNAGDYVVVLPGYILQPLNYYYSNTTDRTILFGVSTAKELDKISEQKVNSTVFYVVTGDIMSANPNGDALAWLKEHSKPLVQKNNIVIFASG